MTGAAGVGVDLVEIDRVERAIGRRPSLAARVFSPAELELAGARARPGQHLATRFAAKEAALKALGIGGLRLHEVVVEGGGDGPPRIRLEGEAARRADQLGVELELSLTHSRQMACAVVIARPRS